jgi:hypothetical protein
MFPFLFALFLIGCGGGGSSNSNPQVITDAQVPTITSNPQNAAYTQNTVPSHLNVTATVDDGGNLSYQWYSNNVSLNDGGTLINGETSDSFTPQTNEIGTFYYYVVVTNTNNNASGVKTANETSNVAEIVVNAPIVIEITNQAELNAIRTNLSGNYILLNDIVLDGNSWLPIGNDTDPFTGVFNGNNHTIAGLYININAIYAGLFGYLTGSVSDLGVEIATGGIYNHFNPPESPPIARGTTGGIAGYVNGGSIVNSYTIGNVTSSGSFAYAGGIAGVINNSSIINSYSNGNITSGEYAGGIAGVVIDGSVITGSYSTGNIKGRTIGGITGSVNIGNIIDSYFIGNVTTSSGFVFAGGITSAVNGGNVTNSYAIGNISTLVNPSYAFIGGIAGYVGDDIGGGWGSIIGSITNCVAANQAISVNSTNLFAKRVVGEIRTASVVINNFANSYMLINESIVPESAENGKDKAIVELQDQNTYEDAINGDGLGGLGWKFGDNDTHPWKIDASKNNGYPYLYWQEL